MNDTKHAGKVIPFQQNASFYMKRGAKEMEKNDLINALFQYRKAYEHSPSDPEACLAAADILSQMQRFEESNRLLYVQMSMGETLPETYFGLACNYFGMHEFDYAADSLERYLDLDPDGYYAYDAEDFLDLIDDDDSMTESTGLSTDEDYETDGTVMFAKHFLDSMQIKEAIETLEAHLKRYPNALRAKNQLSLSYYIASDYDKASMINQQVLAADPSNPQALSNRALFLYSQGKKEEADKTLELLLSLDAQTPDVLQNAAILQIDFGRYDEALKTLTKLSQTTPYDSNLLHRMGFCRFMLGDKEGAQREYRKLMRIDPHDTVAKYYYQLAKHDDPSKNGASVRWSVSYQVPFPEVFRRLNHINRILSGDEQARRDAWKNDAWFRDLVVWGVSLPEDRAKRSMLALAYTFGDEQAERILRDFLLRTDQTDDMKRLVMGMLKRMEAKEPYMAYLGGEWIQGRVNILAMAEQLPQAYASALYYVSQLMADVRSEACIQSALDILRGYAKRMGNKLPRLSRLQEPALAAALEYLACLDNGVDTEVEELCLRYRITQARLRHAVEKLRPEKGEL